MANFAALNEKCGARNNITALSSFSTGMSALTMLLAVPVNLFVMISLYREHKKKKLTFLKLVLNLAAADFITGLIVCPSSVVVHLKEALMLPFSNEELFLLHFSLFFADGVALIALTTLSLDRLICMIYPIRYFKGVSKKYQYLFLVLPWPLGALFVLPYFKLLFIRQLAFYTGVNIVVAIISLFVTMIGTRYVLNSQSKKHHNWRHQSNDKNMGTNEQETSQHRNQAKITRAFQRLIVVFIIAYLPTAITMIYMNVCQKCDCVIVHVMRDLSMVSLLSSSVLRPIIFIRSLTILSKKFWILCNCCLRCPAGVGDRKVERSKTIEVFIIGSSSATTSTTLTANEQNMDSSI